MVHVGLEWMVMVINAILINRNKLLNWSLVSISIYNSPPGRRGTIWLACLVSTASDDIVDRGQQQ